MPGAQKRKKDSQVVNLFMMLLESAFAKAERKYVGEIDPSSPRLAQEMPLSFNNNTAPNFIYM